MSKQQLWDTDQIAEIKGKSVKVQMKEEYYDMVPRATKEERQALKEDIYLNGLNDDMVINDKGFILDGHTRMEICQELGWKTYDGKSIIAKFIVKEFKSVEEEKRYVITTNLVRRHLNPFQRIELYYGMIKIEKARAQENLKKSASLRPGERLNTETGGTGKLIAKQLGMGMKMAGQCIKMLEEGDEILKVKLRNNTISVNKAYQIFSSKKYGLIKKLSRKKSNRIYVHCPRCGSEIFGEEYVEKCHAHLKYCCQKCTWGI